MNLPKHPAGSPSFAHPPARVRPLLDAFPDYFNTVPTPADSEQRKQDYLADTVSLRALLGKLHLRLRSVLVVGTNGKGSVTEFLTRLLMNAGLRVGTLTTPVLLDATEMIRVDGVRISADELDARLREVIGAVTGSSARFGEGQPSQYALMLMAAYAHFLRHGVDIVLAEGAMGGRFDPTCVPNALMTVFTSISNDHADKLGATLADIAENKAGAIARGSLVVAAPQACEEVKTILQRTAVAKNCGFTQVSLEGVEWVTCQAREGASLLRIPRMGLDEVRVPVLGTFQAENLATALTAARRLRACGVVSFDDAAVRRTLESFHVPGRMEVMGTRPHVIVDGAHNLDAVTRLMESLHLHYPGRRLRMVVAMNRDKSLLAQWRLFAQGSFKVYATRSSHARTWVREDAAAVAGPALSWHGDLLSALQAVGQEIDVDQDVVCVAGSLYLVGDFWREQAQAMRLLNRY